jgi:translation initiation factor IF-1
MKKDDFIEVEGVVTECLKGGKFQIKLDSGQDILAYLSGRMKKFRIRVLLGDRVKVQLTPYDLTLGRIIFRSK